MKCLTVISASFILFYLIGFSLGDELGFGESLGNVEGNKRRSLNVRTGTNVIGVGAGPKSQLGQIQQSRPIALTAKPNSPIRMVSSPKMGMTQAVSLPLGVPAFKPLRSGAAKDPNVQTFDAAKNSFRRNDVEIQKSQSFQINMNEPMKIYPVNHQMEPINQGMDPMVQPRIVTPTKLHTMTIEARPNPIPPFQLMPASISRVSAEGTLINDQKRTTQGFQPDPMPIPPSTKLPVIDLMGHTVEELAAAANVSVGVIQSAIKMRQQELLAQQQMEAYQKLMAGEAKTSTTTTTTTTTTTQKPKSQYKIAGGNKVMNAPKEYYPVGYEKNFDDNFTSKVDLPKTTFHCGDQKHFPGLYGDEDLGCMVFHVCALTDDGLIMKSFLCPESTLFDQTVLKCNWWFYVDCKSSKNLYDSNIPVSKSYQLMKALTFFSSYKSNGSEENGVDIESLKNSVNQNSKPT